MTNPPTGPIEVWLTQTNMAVTCRVVHEDERTDELDIDSMSMRGAQREVTGYLIRNGYTAEGRWSAEATGRDGADLVAVETMRRFRPDRALLDDLAAQYTLAKRDRPTAGPEEITTLIRNRIDRDSEAALIAHQKTAGVEDDNPVRSFVYEMEGPDGFDDAEDDQQ
jgi:hypothetical protein